MYIRQKTDEPSQPPVLREEGGFFAICFLIPARNFAMIENIIHFKRC